MTNNQNLRSISGACHEAGHALIARQLGLLVREANYTIGQDGCGGGHVDHLPCAFFEAYLAVAGYVAQCMAAGKTESMHFRVGAYPDYLDLWKLLHPYLDETQANAYQYKLEDDVAGLLNQPEVWKCVVRFGEALFRSGHLAACECMRLTAEIPRIRLVEAQRTMLSPILHDHFGRRIGRAKRAQQEKLLGEVVEKLRPAFQIRPLFSDIRRTLLYEGYSEEEVERLMHDAYGF